MNPAPSQGNQGSHGGAVDPNGMEHNGLNPNGLNPNAGAVDTGGFRIHDSGSIPAVGVMSRRIGTSDLRVHPVALGANVFGWSVDDGAARRILDAFVDGGGTLVDTADSYASGRSETMIGSWIAARGNRDRVVISTKVGKSAENPGLSAKAISAAVHESLQRLRVDTIDLLFLHIDDTTVEFDETLAAVDRLIRDGAVRAFGGSDHTGNRLIQARIACAMLGVAPMVALQNQYSLMHRGQFESDLAHVAEHQQLGVLPRFPLAAGYLTGKYRTRSDIVASRRSGEVSKHFGRRGQRVISVLDEVAKSHEVAPATVALAWLLTKPNIVAPIASATSVEQVTAMLAAPRIQLTRSQVTELDRASAGS